MQKPKFCAASPPLERIRNALQQLASSRPLSKLRHSDIAVVAGLPWQTVRKLLGPRERFAEWLNQPAGSQQTDDSRSRIVAAAARCFAQKGYDRASIDEVAKEAGLTKGAVYWHFKSKDDLFFALLDERCIEMDRYLPEALATAYQAAQSTGDPRQGLVTLITGIFQRIAADPEWSRLFIEFFGQTRDPAVRERLGERYRQFYASAIATIRGSNPNCNEQEATDLAVFWTALIDGLLLAWMINPETIAIEARIERIIHILWDGLGQRSVFPHPPPFSSSESL